MNARIRFGHHGSARAEKPFEYATALAAAFAAELRILAVAQPPEPLEDIETEVLRESPRHHFKDGFATLHKRAHAARLSPKCEVAIGHPAEQIVYHANSFRPGHIVLGHCGKDTFQGWLMGSVSKRIISHSTCSVTVVR